MKKVRIFLGIALVGIAIASAAATKAKTVDEDIYYYNPNNQQIEFAFTGIRPCPELGTACKVDLGGTLYTAYIFDGVYKELKAE